MRNLLRGKLSSGLGGAQTAAAKRLSVGLALAALTLWGFAGWTWWVLLPLLVAGVVARLLVWLFFEPWREWAGPAVLAAVVVFLMTWTSVWADLLAAGLVGLALAWVLRTASPTWLRWAALGVGLALVLSGGLGEFVVWANTRSADRQAAQDDHDLAVSKLRPTSGNGMVLAVVRAVSEDNADTGCWLFAPAAAAELARTTGASDCAAAIHRLHGQITSPRDYANAQPSSSSSGPDAAGVVRASGCDLYTAVGMLDQGPPGGPKLGQLTLAKDPRFPSGGYLITGYARCGAAPPGIPPTSSAPPDVLPSYGPGYAGVLARAIAERDAGVCAYFTDQGKRDFAAAHHAPDCAAAVRALAAGVADPHAYRDPLGATETTGPAGKSIDACHLSWPTAGTGRTPGPQLGTLTLVDGPAGHGYLIAGFRSC
ncbi:hypothetical protein L3Q65_00180 (plasmid) [Amycolatopsis sp. FU40]|uniref:hypothetical protein n=1 Tax=Amycolatopsis sp. FU40 TaxID=2914159 RepID=UPI001F441A1F|nr:hypothetical protein [Amycolatopsis sp. FU40]UKD50716.1 hypothetical protein L3Q65_00180 [Amycolatopsis sp. FU40]